MSSKVHAAIEIGTSRTVLAVGESTAENRLKLLCHAEIPSSGVRKSQITDIRMVTESVKGVLHEIERKQEQADSSLSIATALLVVSGQNVRADPYPATVQVAGARVGDEDVRSVGEAARAMPLPKDRELLDIADQYYALDSLGGITDPKGLAGRLLTLNTLHIHADRSRIDNARTAAAEAHLEISEPLFSATCAADAVLEDHEKANGALVLDLGGGSTGYALYSDGLLVTAGAIGVGGDHVTNDIANAFSTSLAQAEDLKLRHASAVVGRNAEERVRIAGSSVLMDSRTISAKALDTVVNARLQELVSVIGDILDEQDLLRRLHAGVVLTGGGAAMRDLDQLVQRELGVPVRVGRPIRVDGFGDEVFPPAFASIAGALLYAHRSYGGGKSLFDVFGGLFK